jgi:hypothetical protein
MISYLTIDFERFFFIHKAAYSGLPETASQVLALQIN